VDGTNQEVLANEPSDNTSKMAVSEDSSEEVKRDVNMGNMDNK